MNQTLSVIMAVILGFGVTAALGFVVIPWLKKLHFGQTILEIGPSWHKNKQGTPNMGGFMFIVGIVSAFAVAAVTYCMTSGKTLQADSTLVGGSDLVLLGAGLLLALGSAIIGFLDDYTKVIKKRNKGLSAKQKTIAQLLLAFAFLLTLYLSGNTWWYLPFLGKVDIAHMLLGLPYWVIGVFIVYGGINSVNLTDGVDGLCSSVTVTVAAAFLAIAGLQKFVGLGILAAAVLGGCLGFLVWNWNPAKVFMGDTGSLFLGGIVVAMGFACKCPLILLPIGIIYVSETMSDIIQIGYFKLTHGKRVFKMAPIHHHFEMCGWKEKKICIVFSTVSVIGCAIGYALMYFGGSFG